MHERTDIHEYRRLLALGDRLPKEFEAALIHPALSERTARAIFGLATTVTRTRRRHADFPDFLDAAA